jgi:hypothetical protein
MKISLAYREELVKKPTEESRKEAAGPQLHVCTRYSRGKGNRDRVAPTTVAPEVAPIELRGPTIQSTVGRASRRI